MAHVFHPGGADRNVLFQGFCKQVILWSKLCHPNILKLLGVLGDMDQGQLITVSEWMAGGHIIEYIKHNSVNRLELVHYSTLSSSIAS